jgi:hypothetical protein
MLLRNSAGLIAAISAVLLLGAATRSAKPHGLPRPEQRAIPQNSGGGEHRQACAAARWSDPIELGWPSGFTWRSTIVSDTRQTYIFGDDQSWFGHVAPARPLVAIAVERQKQLGIPALGRQFIAPIGADSPAGIQVLWGEDTRDGVRGPPGATELWWSTLRRGSDWSPARRLFATSRIYWSKAAAGRSVAAANGSVSFAAPVSDNEGGGILVVRVDGSSATSHLIRRSSGVVYTGIAQNSAGQIVIAFIGGAAGVARDVNSVFTVRSKDSGVTWSAQNLVSLSASQPASQVRVLAEGKNTWHLIWLQSLSETGKPDVVREIMSTDGGDTWSAPRDLNIPNRVSLLRAVLDRCGAIHILAEYHPDGQAIGEGVLYARLARDSTWSSLSHLFDGANVTDPDITIGLGGLPALTALEWMPPSAGGAMVRIVVAHMKYVADK